MLFAANAICRYCADAGIIVNGGRNRSFAGGLKGFDEVHEAPND